MNNETLREKLEEFIRLFESETKVIKEQVNYNKILTHSKLPQFNYTVVP